LQKYVRIGIRKEGAIMKKNWTWILAVAVLGLVVVAFAVRIWFNAPGIRILGDEIHADLHQKCYIIDGQTQEVIDETTVTVKGATSRSDQKLFDGDLKIIGYQNSASGTIESLKSIEVADNGCWMISHLENCTHSETDENGITKDVEHFCDYSYTYYLYPDAPEQTIVLIESFVKYEPLYAVCANSEEEALSRYEEFMKHKP
jgi:hypothetical protein